MALSLVSSIRRLTGNLVETLQKTFAPESSSSSAQKEAQAVLDDLNQLHRTLRRVNAVLHDAEEREIRDQLVELWLSDLRAVAYEAEDALEEYHYELLRADLEEGTNGVGEASCSNGSKRKLKEMPIAPVQFSSFSDPCATAHVSVLNEIAAWIKQIKIKFQEICESRQNLSLREEDGERQYYGLHKRQPSTSYVEEIGVIGREEDKEKLIHLLTSESSSFSVIPVVGMGGVGKTTLAQFIYNDVRVRQFFDQRVWICVSDESDFISLTQEIIESITREPCNFTQPNTLQVTLMENVAKRKLLLVLDDVWSNDRELCGHIQVSLQSAQVVRILMTTRETCVAEIMQASVPSYQLGALPDENSLILFRNCAFGTQDPVEYSDLVEIGNQIVRKCDGLPLAIKVLGGILRYDRDRCNWNDILRCYTWELDAGRKEILSALKLSYYRMPSHLRPCFLFFSMFPKDHEFRRDLVIRMWMAQGYIYAQGNKRLEDIGIKYFEELYGRSLLLSFNKFGEVVYKMHVMIHELTMSLSKRMCSGISYGVQHLYAKNNKVLPEFFALNNSKALRTLVNYSLGLDASVSCSIISTMSYLRVLQVEVYGTELPESIGSLKHLRYLNVIGRNLRRLPESCCLLYNLQTLDLQIAPFLLELPCGIGNLINLRFIRVYSEVMNKLPESICLLPHLQILDLKCCYKLSALPLGIEQLTSLCCFEIPRSTPTRMICCIEKFTKLQYMDAKLLISRDNNHKGLGEVKDLVNLRGTLCISGLENIVDVEHSRQAHLISKSHLQNLKLRWRVFDEFEVSHDREEEGLYLKVGPNGSGDAMNSEEMEKTVLESLQPHRNIKNLTIHGYNGLKFPKWVGDPEALSKLTDVVLWDCNLEGNNLSCLSHLPSLKSLWATGLSVALIGERDCHRRYSAGIIFSSLKTLEFRFMNKWEGFCIVKGDFPCLEKLSLEDCPRLMELPIIPSLEELHITKCPSLERFRLSEYISEEHPPKLHTLRLVDCPGFSPMLSLGCLNKLKQLEITGSPFIKISLPIHSELQLIHITRCKYLCSVDGLEQISSITDMQLAFCPWLEFRSFMALGSMPEKLKIIDCRKLNNWCQMWHVNYFRKVPSHKEVNISNGEIQSARENYQDPSRVYLCSKPHFAEQLQDNDQLVEYYFCTVIWDLWDQLPNRDLPTIVQLELNNCKKVVSVFGFNHLRFLKHLVVSYCSELCNLLDECLPATLESLLVMECQKLSSIPSLRNSSALEELQIWNCSELRAVVGLQCLTKLETLMVIQCEKICISPVERLCAKLDVIVRDCPSMREWCQVNSVPYLQWWFGGMNSEEGEKVWHQLQTQLDRLKL